MSRAAVSVARGGQTFHNRVREVIRQALDAHGIGQAQIDIDPRSPRGKFRVWVISDDFEPLSIAERQDIIWRALERSFELAEMVRISMVLTFTSQDIEGDISLVSESPIEGKRDTRYEVLAEEDLGHSYSGHGTSQTCLFVIKPSKGKSFALYVSYPLVLLVSQNWTDADRWRDARKQVRRFLEAILPPQLAEAKQFNGWARIKPLEWLKTISEEIKHE